MPIRHFDKSPLPSHVHFVGIGGVGMSGLATILLDLGVRVSGSDTVESAPIRRLRISGGRVFMGHSADNVPLNTELLVYSSAVPAENPERHMARAHGIRTIRRGLFLAELARHFPTVIAIAGSHGKTTTTAMLAHIFRRNNRKPGFLIGGEVPGWCAPASAGNGRVLITEVDESDGTQAGMASSIAAILNIEDDHSWSVGGQAALEDCFKTFASHADTVIAWDSGATRGVLQAKKSARFIDAPCMDDSLRPAIPGRHNLINAAMAIEIAGHQGINRAAAIRALSTFPGVARRMSRHFTSPDTRYVIIEDYAHHPTELQMTLEGLRETCPGYRLHVIFQPHRFERIKRFGKQFSQLLSTADAVTVYDTFAAWVDDAEAANARQILDDIQTVPANFCKGQPGELARTLAASLPDSNTLFAVIGAGDVCNVIAPLKAALISRELTRMADLLRETIADCDIRTDIPWSRRTTLGIGKACPLVASPQTEQALQRLLKTAHSRHWPVRILGHGSNLIGSDSPMIELVICLGQGMFTDMTVENTTVVVGGGCSLPGRLKEAGQKGLADPCFAPLAWIPGTVGGALRMNAGAGRIDIGRTVEKVRGFFLDGTPFEQSGNAIAWSYRSSHLLGERPFEGAAPRSGQEETEAGQGLVSGEAVICRAWLNLGSGDPSAFAKVYQNHGEWRRKTHPGGPSAGCVFRNAGDTIAGKLIDHYGFKGQTVGGCRVSGRHANFILSSPDDTVARPGEKNVTGPSEAIGQTDAPPKSNAATEMDFLQLAGRIKAGIYQKTGINLSPEVHFVNPETETLLATSVEPLTVTVLKGGPSEEREISLISGGAVAHALREAGLTVYEVDVQSAGLPRIPADTDVVFPVLHGTFGEDGQLQKLLEQAGWTFVGSGSQASHIAMVKSKTKTVLEREKIPTAPYMRVTRPDTPVPVDFPFPVIVKPDAQGSSVGMTKLDTPDPETWEKALEEALAVDTAALVEQFIPGTEITVGILQGKALPVCEIIPPDGHIFDYDAKYDHTCGQTDYLCPPRHVSQKAQRSATTFALTFYEAIQAKDLLRVDFIIDANGVPQCLEANSIPGFTPSSLLPKAAAQTGIAFPELCARLVKGARTG